jgi:hypothetical protein
MCVLWRVSSIADGTEVLNFLKGVCFRYGFRSGRGRWLEYAEAFSSRGPLACLYLIQTTFCE